MSQPMSQIRAALCALPIAVRHLVVRLESTGTSVLPTSLANPTHLGDSPVEHRFAFVLRIWLTESATPDGNTTATLRGTLQAVDSSEIIHFASLCQLDNLLHKVLQPPESSSGCNQ